MFKSSAFNSSVLEIFIRLDPALILHSWIEELIEKDNSLRHLQLFTEEEEKRFYEEDEEKRFKGTLLLRSGVVSPTVYPVSPSAEWLTPKL